MSKKSKAASQADLKKHAASIENDGAVDMPNGEQKLPVEGGEIATKEKAPEAPKEPGKIAKIIALHKAGVPNKEIQTVHGFHPTTISIQISKYKKAAEKLFGKTDEEIVAAKFDPEYVNGLQTSNKAKAEAKAAADKAKAEADLEKSAKAKAEKEAKKTVVVAETSA